LEVVKVETVVLRLKGESRLYLGSYDTQFHEEDPFRAQSLKGLWRYWLRAYIAGAMYEAGILKCERRGEYVCKSDLEKVVEKTGYLLGSLKSASKFRIVVSKASARRREDGFRAQRARLLSLGRRRISYGEGAYAEIKIEKSPHVEKLGENEVKLAIGSLLTALSLNGLGKGGRRGLGTFSVEVDGFEGRFLKNKRIDYSMIRELIGETLRSARSYLNLGKGNPSEIPPVDCISEAKIDLSGINGSTNLFNKKEVPVFTVIRAKPRSRKDIETMVIELQDFFYRPERSRKMGFMISSADKSQDPITRGRLAWFLGLPRTQRGTGYLNAERRASPVHLAVHENETLFTLFLSGDWPTEIRWKGIGRPVPLRIDLSKVKEAYLTSISSLEGYLDRIGYETEVIFP
jgi:CRISPR-associated protein Cmr1